MLYFFSTIYIRDYFVFWETVSLFERTKPLQKELFTVFPHLFSWNLCWNLDDHIKKNIIHIKYIYNFIKVYILSNNDIYNFSKNMISFQNLFPSKIAEHFRVLFACAISSFSIFTETVSDPRQFTCRLGTAISPSSSFRISHPMLVSWGIRNTLPVIETLFHNSSARCGEKAFAQILLLHFWQMGNFYMAFTKINE